MKPIIPALALALSCPIPTAWGQVLIPNLGDTNCDGQSNVVDAQLAIVSALGLPLNSLLDQNQDGLSTDARTMRTVSGNCTGKSSWNGAPWACERMR